jgi:hypothetical protein
MNSDEPNASAATRQATGRLHRLLAVLRVFLSALMVLGAACWLCIYPVMMVAAGLIIMTGVPQGNELLKWTADSTRTPWIFYLTIVIWAASAWYCSRVLLERRFRPFGSAMLESDTPFARFVRTWLPRALGVVVFVALSLHFWGELHEPVIALVIAGLGVAFAVFVVTRRPMQRRSGESRGARSGSAELGAATRRSAEGAPDSQQIDRLPRATKGWLVAWLVGALALFLAFIVSEVWLPRAIGAGPIILLAFTGWTLFGGILLVLLPKAYGLTSMALLPLLFVAAASTTDNHAVRTLPDTSALSEPVAAPVSTAETPLQPAGPVAKAFIDWLKANPAFKRAVEEGRPSFPVYIVSAEGGGLRAGYWAATVLGELEAATEGRFSQHVFAISGVSGGSLGGAAFVAEVTSPKPCSGAPPDANAVRACVSHYLNGDFLSPVVAYLLFPDLVQRFLPVSIRHFDRARAIESSWEASWRDMHPDGAKETFAEPFKAIVKPTPQGYPAPLLFFNATKVETGERVLVAPVRIDSNEFPEVRDLFKDALKGHTLRLSSAVHLSARFTYVSPAAKICKGDKTDCGVDDMWGRVVDGGYHENSGALTAHDILRAVRRTLRPDRARGKIVVEPRVIIITNDPGSARLCSAFLPDASARPGERPQGKPSDPAKPLRNQPRLWLPELMSPLDALLNTRVARGTHARRTLADVAAGGSRKTMEEDCLSDQAREGTLEFAMPDGESPALGWFLGKASRDLMHNALCRGEHVQMIATARKQVLGVDARFECQAEPVPLNPY